MRYTKTTLRNGLRVILAPMADVASTTVMVMTGTGSRYEDARENGLAHFLEHMFFKGTPRRPRAEDISHALDAVGGSYNAFTGKDRTAYYAKVPAVHADVALDVVSDLFLNALLRPRDIRKERGAVLQEIKMYRDMPSRMVHEVFDALLYGAEHPLGRPILGPEENVTRFTRRALTAYLARHYTTHNTVVCVAGALAVRKTLAKIRADFAPMRTGRTSAPLTFAPTQTAPRVRLVRKRTDQTHVVLGVPAYGVAHPDRYALAVLSALLGEGMSSRLFVQVREKRGLAYSIHTGLERYAETGAFYAAAGVAHEHLAPTVRLILAEFAKVRRTLVPQRELQKVKEAMKGHLVLGLETSDDIAAYLIGQEVTRGEILAPEEICARIDAVTARDVRRVARDVLVPTRYNLAAIGPHAAPMRKELQSLLSVAY